MPGETPSTPHPLNFLFHPRSVAVAGVSSKARLWGTGNHFVKALKAISFPGPIYPVNPKLTESDGLRCYPSLLAIEGPVDHLISAVPAAAVPGLLEDAITKGVRSMHLFTSGFRETGEGERIELEQQILSRARDGGIRLIGPNCMGLYDPRSGLSFDPFSPRRPGNVGMLSQSGANAEDLMNGGAVRGIRYSKIISYGNALDLAESDFLDYLAWDPETAVIAAYQEGPKDGRRFFETMRAVAMQKPVLLLKGGLTEAGQRAARSHTGSLAGSEQLWQAFERQTGFVLAQTMEQLEDLVVAFSFLAAPRAAGVAIVGGGGGTSVLAADAAARAGLQVPPLSEATQRALLEFTPIAGTSVRNPVDTSVTLSAEQHLATLRLAGSDPGIGLILAHAWLRDHGPDETLEDAALRTRNTLVAARDETGTPLALSVRMPLTAGEFEHLEMLVKSLAEDRIPVFPSMTRAAWALGRWMAWHARRRE